MYAILTLFIGIVCLILMYLFKKPLFSVSGLFIMVWTICLGLSAMGLYGMNKPTLQVLVLSWASMVIFMFFSILKKHRLHLVFEGKNCKDVSEYSDRALMSNPLIYLFNILAYLFSIPYLKKSLSVLVSKGIYYVREGAFNGDGEIASTLVLSIFQYVIGPFFITTIIFTAIDISNKHISVKAILFTVINVALYTLLFAGRFMIMEFLLLLILVNMDTIPRKSIIAFIKRHRKIVIIAGLLVFCLIFLTIKRSSGNIFKSAYVYFCGPFSYLSYLIDEKIGSTLFLYGKTFFGFIYNTIYSILTGFFNVEYKGSNHIITSLTQYMVPIGGGITYNSMGTMLHDFICDFGIYGSLAEVCVYAYVCNYIEMVALTSETYFTKALYYYILLTTIFSIFSYQFRGPGSFFVIVFLFIFTRNRRMGYEQLINERD